ncbi:MAG: class II aldolase/adducin family protein [Oligoflexales bacterium]
MNYLKNPMIAPSPFEKCLLKEMVEIAKDCYYRGWAPATSGNFSIHLREGLVWQSPSGVCKGRLRPNSFIPISLIKKSIWGFGLGKPSEEMLVHLKIYEQSNARCVVHAHPPHFIKLSMEKSVISFQGYEMQKALGCNSYSEQINFKIAPNQTQKELENFCDKQLAHYIEADSRFIMFEGHGIYAWADSPLKALQSIEAVESLCTGMI